jgi:ketosteroid isomerase-like protein
MAGVTAEAELEATYRTYVEIFNREDSAALAQLLAYPAVGGGNASPQVYKEPVEFQRMIEGTFAHFKAKGWARSQVDSTEGVVMAGDTGLVRAVFSRCRADGGVYESGSGNYVMRRIDGRWKIVAMLVA